MGIFYVAFSPIDALLVSGDEYGKLMLWYLSDGDAPKSLDAHDDDIHCVRFSPRGDMLASASSDKSTKVWDIPSGRIRYTLPSPGAVYSVAFSPDGAILASGSQVNRESGAIVGLVTLWEVATGRPIRSISAHEDSVVSLSFSPDGKTVATAAATSVFIRGKDHTIRLWDVSNGQQTGSLEGHANGVTNVVFSPDGTTLASAGRDWTLIFWDVANLKELRRIPGENIYNPDRVRFTPDGTTVVLASFATGLEALKFRDVATGDLRFSLRPHRDRINSVAISPDGRTIATPSKDRTIRLLRAASQEEVRAAGW